MLDNYGGSHRKNRTRMGRFNLDFSIVKTECLVDHIHLDRLKNILSNRGFCVDSLNNNFCLITNFPKRVASMPFSILEEKENWREFEDVGEFSKWIKERLQISVNPRETAGCVCWSTTFRSRLDMFLHSEHEILRELEIRLSHYCYEF